MIEQLIAAFDSSKKKLGDRIIFTPEIKVKRQTDTIYISQVKKTTTNNLLATVEVYDGKRSDKAPMPVTMLSDVAQRTILNNL